MSAASGAGTTAAECSTDAGARGRRLLAALQPATDAMGRVSAARFDVTDLPGDLFADLFVVRAGDDGFVPVLTGVRARQRVDRLAGVAGAEKRALARCVADRQPVRLAGHDGIQDAGLLVPLQAGDGVSHVLGLFPGQGEATPVDAYAAGFDVANLPLPDLPAGELPAHAEIRAYWAGKRERGRLPARRDIDPVEIPHLLRHLLLIDVLGPPLDFRYRLLGDEILLRARPGLKGQRFREIDGKGPGSSVWHSACKVVETGLPRFGRAGYVGPDRYTAAVDDLLMPLSEDGSTVTQLLILAQFRTRGAVVPDARLAAAAGSGRGPAAQ